MAGQTDKPAQDPQNEQTPEMTEPDPHATVETPTAAAEPPATEPAATPEPATERAVPSDAPEPPTAPAAATTSEPSAAPAAGPEPEPAPEAATPEPSPAPPVAAPEAPAPPAGPPPAPTDQASAAPAAAPAADAAEPSEEYPWLRGGTGQHAVPRPYPPTVARVPMAESMATPPGTAGVPAGDPTAAMPADPGETATLPTPDAAAAGAAGAAVGSAAVGSAAAGGPGTIAPTGPAQPTRRAQLREPAELPELPPRPGFARHALGFLVGLVVTPIALVLTGAGVGGFRALDPTTADQAFDATNFSLIAVGVALLIAVVVLALWSPAVPLTGGLVWGVGLGVLYLGWPSTVEGWIDQAYSTRPAALDQLVATLDDGTWLVLGLLVAVAGLAVALARRMGRRFGEHTTLATHARIEAARAEETRRQAADAEEAARAERARSIT